MKKNRIINMSLSERKELNTRSTKVIKDSIKLDIQKIENAFKLLEELNIEREILEEEETRDSYSNDIFEEIFLKDFEIEDEIISINCKILPSNYFTLQPYSNHTDLKNNILYGLSQFIKDNFKSNNWKNSICIFAIKNEIRTTDLDNYYCKPFLDAIVLSKLITSDSYKNVSLIYTINKNPNSALNIKIINKDTLKNHKELVLKELL